MDRRAFLASSVAAAALSGPAGAAPADPFPAVLEALLALSPEQATGAGLDTGARSGLKYRLDPRDAAHRLRIYDALIEARPALQNARNGASGRYARFLDSALWVSDIFAGFRRFSYASVDGGYYPVPFAVTQMSGAYKDLPDFLDVQHAVATRNDAEAYLDRLADFAKVVEAETALCREQAASGAAPPDFILDRTVTQLQQFQAAQSGATPGLVASLVRRTTKAGLAGDWEARASALVTGPLATAIARQAALIEGLKRGARPTAGVGELPDGQAFYARCLAFHTSTDLSPDAAHAIGLEQVKAISAEARAVLDAQGVTQGTVADGIKALWTDPRDQFPDTDAGRAQVLAFIQGRLDDIKARLPKAFSALPKTPLEVRRVPPEIELGAPGAYSQGGSIDGSRPGAIYFNLADTRNWPRWVTPTTVYHEGLPGHHLAASFANEAEDIPTIFKLLVFNAYNEGWALYAEQLADELGVYDDAPLGRLGRLQDSLFRACRIVVDTGLHAKGWSRERAIAYVVDNAGSTPDDARREIERYCSWPGQACGYKIGHLEFLRLRAAARSKLGQRFDLKAFHDTVLRNGPMPLTSLSHTVDAWISASR
jgi:uncharacterized protein (DUF885 family)